MQQASDVRVVVPTTEGPRVVGHGEAVTRDVVVMRVADRGAAPTLPLQVLVPVAAGGDRDEHGPGVDVEEIVPAEGDEPYVALRLAHPLPGHVAPRPTEDDLPGAGASADTRSSLAAGTPWYCRAFPWLC